MSVSPLAPRSKKTLTATSRCRRLAARILTAAIATALPTVAIATISSVDVSPVSAADWTRFLGPNGSSVAADSQGLVEKWSDDENVLWKSELPGRGVSSPIIIGDKLFVTSYSGYGTGGTDEKMENLKRHVTCLNAKTGSEIWSHTIDAVQPEDPYEGPGVPSHGYASHTPVSDGEHLFVFLGKSGVIAYDFDGNELWRRSVGTGSGPMKWGSAASPILYQSDETKLLIIPASEESETIFAFDPETGKEVWKSEASSLSGSWSTPTLAKSGDQIDLVLMVPGEVWGMNPETGKLRWYSRGTSDNTTSASPIVAGDVVYAIGGRGGDSVAVRAGGSGDVNDSHVVWDAKIPGRFSSPIISEDHIFVSSDGVISVYDAKSGDKLGQQRLPTSSGDRGDSGGRGGRRGGFGNITYATPVLADGKLYIPTASGDFHVVAATPELEIIATNKLTDPTGFSASPAVSNGRLYIRSGGAVYCIGKE